MSNQNPSFKEILLSPKVTRRDYSKINFNFDGPNLLDIQKNSFKQLIDVELKNIVSSIFPIESPLKKYTIKFEGINIGEPLRSPERCREEGKTYEAPLHVDLVLVNNETGEVTKTKKNKSSKNDGIFFGNIPLMTEKGTFIVNGIEKIVISQIIRSPGMYVLNKSQIKLKNSRKRQVEGNICEMLPYKGTLMLVLIPEGKDYVQIMARDSGGENAAVFMATTLLKALGLTEQEILNVYQNDQYIINTLNVDEYKVSTFINGDEFNSCLKAVREDIRAANNSIETVLSSGAPIELPLKRLMIEYIQNEDERALLMDKLESPELLAKSDEAKLLNEQIAVINEKNNRLLDKIITESAARKIAEKLALSAKTLDVTRGFNDNEKVSYQGLVTIHLFHKRYYDISNAGRYKFNRKLRISERLYQQTIAEDICDKNGNIVIARNTTIGKNELDLIKKYAKENNLAIDYDIKVANPLSFSDDEVFTKIERVKVYGNVNSDTPNIVELVGIGQGCESNTLTLADIVSTISYAFDLDSNIGFFDDIDHLGNKRLKVFHELLSNRLSSAMIKVEKYIRERLAMANGRESNNKLLNSIDPETGELLNDGLEIDIESENESQKPITIKNVINTKSFQVILKDFFNSYQLIQFIDQQNPLSELTNKRRISAMGPGGISREDPNLDIRDVHYSHYGRICPIETPEGMNVGLILSLASFAKVDENGFILTPYRKVINGVVTNEIEWLTASQDDEYIIAQSSENVDENGKILDEKIIARYRGSSDLFDPIRVDYMDVLPKQVVSAATSCVPFLENDDANRALMGANMQRQAVPLIRAYSPWVATGSEIKIAHDSGMACNAKKDGIVKAVDGKRIIISNDDGSEDTYELTKYQKSNQDTNINQTPIVDVNQRVKEGQTIADGPSMNNGELALGRNILVGFTTWNGYNYEDAVIVSNRLIQNDYFTSIHIDEYEVKCVTTKNGDEEITREMPNVAESAKKYLDEDGIIMVGAEVKEGDVLVGKTTPRGQVALTPEEKLLYAIFNERAKHVKDSSLKVPHGGEGIVAAVKRFKSTEQGTDLEDDVIEIVKVYVVQKRKIQVGDKMSGRHGNKGVISNVVPMADMPFMDDGTPIDILLNPLGVPSRMNIGQILEIHLGLAARQLGQKELLKRVFNQETPEQISNFFGIRMSIAGDLIEKVTNLLKEYNVTSENELEKIPMNELLFVLNNLGLRLDDIGYKVKTPVFDGATNDDIYKMMDEAGLDTIKNKGKYRVRDGKTGEYFDGPISVGVMYMLKLDHMVDDKIHARSVGPYSKITQQPLGGKSQNGGQRFGEMEVWALEAYGAAHNLREILTIKSDDVRGRNQTYNAIVKGNKIPIGGMPESFKLLTKQLQGLGLYMDIIDNEGNCEDINKYIGHEYDDLVEEAIVEENDNDGSEYATLVEQDYDVDDDNDNFEI